MSTYHCEKPVPHRHSWPMRSDGLEPQIGDVIQCDCGKYAVYKSIDYGPWWVTRPAWWARYLIWRCQR